MRFCRNGLIAAFVIGALAVLGSGTLAAEAIGGGKHAVVVGVNEYAQAPHLRLRAAVNDARAVAEALTGAPDGFAKDEVALLLNETHDAILQVLRETAEICKPGDLLLLYYSGQEAVIEGELYLLPADGKREPSPQNIAFAAVEGIL